VGGVPLWAACPCRRRCDAETFELYEPVEGYVDGRRGRLDADENSGLLSFFRSRVIVAFSFAILTILPNGGSPARVLRNEP
jgi:hypothetical protein